MSKIKVGITVGDINGIGLEVILKALSNKSILDMCTPIIYGSSKVVAYHKNIAGQENLTFSSISDATRPFDGKINVVNCWADNVVVQLGNMSEIGGKHAYIALDRACNDLENDLIDVLVTGPINKKAMQMANFPFAGHTEYLQSKWKDQGSSLMLLVNEDLRVAVATGHIPLSEVASNITTEGIRKSLKTLTTTLKRDFGIEKPKIAVLGLNPHAGDESALGMEEEEIIKPLLQELKNSGQLVVGPYSADGFFGTMMYKKFDAVLAMYHDQGLIPFKSIAFHDGVNYTAGLPVVRTSPDHGTAFEIAGKNEADPQSMRNAIYLAIDVFRRRREFDSSHESQVQKSPKPSEDIIK